MKRDLTQLSQRRVPFLELQCVPPHAVLLNRRNQMRISDHNEELQRTRTAQELRLNERHIAEWNAERGIRSRADCDDMSVDSESTTALSPVLFTRHDLSRSTIAGTQLRMTLLDVPDIDDETVEDIMNTFPSLGLLIQHLTLLSIAELSRLRPAWRHLHYHYGPY